MKLLNYYLTTFGLLVLFLIQGCQEQKKSSLENENSKANIENEIKEEIDALYEVYTKSDLKWVDFYKDVYTVASTDGSIQTKYADSLRVEWANIYKRYDVILREHGEPTIIASGNQAFHYNTFDEIFIKKATKDTTKSVGTWIVLWKKQSDDSWKIEFETYHSK